MTSVPAAVPEPWGHNAHYYPAVLRAAPAGCERALDVGCGQGALTRLLSGAVPHVTGVDRDERSIEIARGHHGGAGIAYLVGDFFDIPLEDGSLDLVASVAALHHMEEREALRRMAALLRPGGVLAVIGLARIGSPADLIREIPAQAGYRLHRVASARAMRAGQVASSGYTSPVVWPPPLTYGQTRELARSVLPGVRFRSLLYWRYSLMWSKPA